MRQIWRFAVLAVLLLAQANTGAWGGNRVIFTVDVESNETFSLPQQVDAICQDGSACGLMDIARMLKERQWAGTFFLNVYEHHSWGETVMRDIVAKLQAAGQDVALHTHPQWAYDPSRNGMHQYSLEEQTTIIRDGVRLLETWTERPVVAHRAGAYMADEHTLEALQSNDIRIDSSLFWKHPWSRLNGLGLPRNLPSSWGQLIEIPVTVYQREDQPPVFSNFLSTATSIRKIDPDWFLNKEEAIAAIDAIVEADLPFVVVFLHSFSFLRSVGNDGAPVGDQASIDIFRAILDQIDNKRLSVVTMRDIAESKPLLTLSQDKDVIPQVTVRVNLHNYLWERLKSAKRETLAAVGSLILILVGYIAFLLITTRSRRLAINAKL